MHADDPHDGIVGVHVYKVEARLGAPLGQRLTLNRCSRFVPAHSGRPGVERHFVFCRVHALAQEVQQGFTEALRDV